MGVIGERRENNFVKVDPQSKYYFLSTSLSKKVWLSLTYCTIKLYFTTHIFDTEICSNNKPVETFR